MRTGISLSFLPAIIIGCSDCVLPLQTNSRQAPLLTMKDDCSSAGNTLDILVFEDDRLRRLDSYQRFEDFTGPSLSPASTGGKKIFLLCMNAGRDRYDWAEICSYSSLQKIRFDLEKENRRAHVMTGEYRGLAGDGINTTCMIPLVCEVRIESLRRDFCGTPYENEPIKDVKAYLTNVNASCGMLDRTSAGISRLINAGMCNHHDVKAFDDPSMIVQEVTPVLDHTAVKTEKSFLCYSNTGDRSRSTRIVIEGKIGTETYFWPIEVGNGNGVERNCTYTYDIQIRRKGTSDPDNIIDPASIDIGLRIKPWKEKEDYQVSF